MREGHFSGGDASPCTVLAKKKSLLGRWTNALRGSRPYEYCKRETWKHRGLCHPPPLGPSAVGMNAMRGMRPSSTQLLRSTNISTYVFTGAIQLFARVVDGKAKP